MGMNRVFDFVRVRLVRPSDETDRQLLDLFLASRDEGAFAELVRRYGPLVWGVCSRRLKRHDAEDAFQATFLVLLRRANRLGDNVPLGPWLYRVAVMTVRNTMRGNRRRADVSAPMGHEQPAPAALSVESRLDLETALLSLPERDRAAVVLCHLQGFSHREAAARLGCSEGTLSARLSRALARLRARFGVTPAILVATGAVSLPSGLTAATVRVGIIYLTSNLTAAAPTVAGITQGVLRMFWLKKATTGLALTVLVATGLSIGLAVRSYGAADATDPVPLTPVDDPKAPPKDPEEAKRALDRKLDDLKKKAAEIEKAISKAKAEKAKLEEAQKEKARAAKLEGYLEIVCHEPGNQARYTLREVIGGKVREMSCNDLEILTTYATRAYNDPKGPKKVNVSETGGNLLYTMINRPLSQSDAVLAACAKAGYTKATLFRAVPQDPLQQQWNLLTNPQVLNNTLTQGPWTYNNPLQLAQPLHLGQPLQTYNPVTINPIYQDPLVPTIQQTEIDLTKYKK